VRRLALARLRMLHPGEDDQTLVLRAFVQSYGAALAKRVYGRLPEGVDA
jgi:hypothetical protein